jgi:hypothetical protein
MNDTAIVAKIKKLLALAQSDNANEAALAASRARELMVQHAISEAQLTPSEREPIETEGLNLGKKRIPHWEALLSYVLAPSFFCRSFYTKGSDIYVVGRKSDREALIATFWYLRNEIKKMSDKAWAGKPTDFYAHGKTWKVGFNEGCVRTIKERLGQDQAALMADNTGTALVLSQRQQETDAWVEQNLKLRTSMARRNINHSGYSEGRQAGHALDLSKRAGASKALTA